MVSMGKRRWLEQENMVTKAIPRSTYIVHVLVTVAIPRSLRPYLGH